jgi:hypothetical protein
MAARSVHRRRSRRASSWASGWRGSRVLAEEGAEAAEGFLVLPSRLYPFSSPFFRSDSPIFVSFKFLCQKVITFFSRFYEKRYHSSARCCHGWAVLISRIGLGQAPEPPAWPILVPGRPSVGMGQDGAELAFLILSNQKLLSLYYTGRVITTT